ncbi:uncharacterized protein C8A04DRAFT_40827 [Dichotomopilus funicola]|uniref:NAD(P)-binding domain-containing protein n=1 Tax=Dichotomopilus funicola TaxID=1934379 RepID=A0AAN6UU79_9PEZI|nr:hypothetical protein C8A04DRAFT_40827 [Dichotomopilus funicola]
MSDQPIQRVAIVGASGRIGGAFAAAVQKTGKHVVTALTRAGSTGTIPEGVKRVEVDYSNEDSLVEALKGQQFLAITLGVSAGPDVHPRIITAAKKAGVSYVMPNIYGYPLATLDASAISRSDLYATVTLERFQEVIDKGPAPPIALSCGFWYEWSLALGEEWFGFTIKDRKVTFFDDGKRQITSSTWEQCGRALAALVSLPESKLAEYKGKFVRIESFHVSQREMLDSLHRVLGTTDADWEITFESSEKRIKDGAEAMKTGNRRGFAKMLYCGVFTPSNPVSDFEATSNAELGLSVEDLDERTKVAIEMVESGWDPLPAMGDV